jgi:hypothetical protein
MQVVAADVAPYGNDQQPGHNLHTLILNNKSVNEDIDDAVESGILTVLEDDSTILPATSKSALAFNMDISNSFFIEMVDANNLTDVVKVMLELYPQNNPHVIHMSVVLYPDFVQDVCIASAMSSSIDQPDLITMIIQSGGDPSSCIVTGTGASVNGNNIPPLGPGIGAGGTGGGDSTVSTN